MNIEPTPTLPPSNLDAVIEQSKQTIAENAQPKRPRGRPPGTFKNKINPENEANKDEFKSVEGVVLKQNEIEPLALELVRTPFDLVGWKAGIDLTPTEAEATAPMKYLSKLIECYLPDLDAKDPKKFNLIALVISYGLLVLKKFRIYAHHELEKKTNKKPQENAPLKPENEAKAPDVSSPNVQLRPLPKDSQPVTGAFSRGDMR